MQHNRREAIQWALMGALFVAFVWVSLWQRNEIIKFVLEGPRFTADDGYELCRRLQELEREHGYEKECKKGD